MDSTDAYGRHHGAELEELHYMVVAIPIIMGAWVVFALWLLCDGWRHARAATRHPPGTDGVADPAVRTAGERSGRPDPGDGLVSRGHGLLLAGARLAAAAGLVGIVAATALGADLLWLALGPPTLILVSGLVAHLGTRWIASRHASPAGGSP
jgi:hypothetical protein